MPAPADQSENKACLQGFAADLTDRDTDGAATGAEDAPNRLLAGNALPSAKRKQRVRFVGAAALGSAALLALVAFASSWPDRRGARGGSPAPPGAEGLESPGPAADLDAGYAGATGEAEDPVEEQAGAYDSYQPQADSRAAEELGELASAASQVEERAEASSEGGGGDAAEEEVEVDPLLEAWPHGDAKKRPPDAAADADAPPPGGRSLCAEDEELHVKLCYKKCALLTDGEFPHRTTAWSCCKEKRCNFHDQKMDLAICGGLDVAGDSRPLDDAGKRCPHHVGVCDEDEALHHGLCFKMERTLMAPSLQNHRRVRLPTII